MTVAMEFCLLGPLTVRVDGVVVPIPKGKQRALLAAMLLRAGRTVTADQLADVLWGPVLPPSAATSLQNYVKRLRQALGTGRDRILTQPGGYLIQVYPGELDIAAMEQTLTAAIRSAQTGNWAEVSGYAVATLAWWRDDALCDVDLRETAWWEIARLTELRFQARELLVEAGLQLGRHNALVAQAQQLTVDAPLREHSYALLMHALYLCGRRAEALEAYQHARDVMVEELGAEAGPELQSLHQQILHDDPALIPAPIETPKVVPRGLPAPARHFAGRSRELAALTRLLDEDESGQHLTGVVAAIGGAAGVGKTALALRWAHQVAGRFPDGQLYVNLRGFDPALPPLSATEALRLALDSLEIPAERIPASLDGQAGMYRSVLAGLKVLIVADNAADAGQVRPLLPGSPGCLVIVTSRRVLTGLVAVDGAIPLSLDVLSSAEASELLARVLGRARVAAEPEAADQLINLCGHLPLALAITAARGATRPRLPLAALAAELADAAGRLDALQASGDPLASVRTALTSSYQQLSVTAARMLRLLALHPGPDISVAAAASLAGLAGPHADRQLAELADASLVSRDGSRRYSLHDLVRLHAAEQAGRADADADLQAATGRMLDHYLHTGHAAALLISPERDPITVDPPSPGSVPEQLPDDRAALSWFEAEHQVLIAAAGHAFTAGQDGRAWNLAWTLDDYLCNRGRWQDRLALQTTALAAARRLGDLTRQASSHLYLGDNASWLSHFDAAECHYQHGLDLYQQVGDPGGQAWAHFGLATLHSVQGRPALAVEGARLALKLYTAAGHRVGRAAALNSLGWNLAQLGDYEQALALCQEALTLSRQVGGRQIEAAALDSLGYAHRQLGQYADAITYYQQSVDVSSEIGIRHHQAEVLSHLGDTHQASGNRAAARASWDRALAILEDLHHPDADQARAKLCRA